MIDLTSAVSIRQSIGATRRGGDSHRVFDNSTQKKPDNRVQDSENSNKTEKFREVAKEIESLFAYQLLKVMRQTANGLSPDDRGLGNDTYLSLFDMEVSRLFAEQGLGLQDAIIAWLERMPSPYSEDNINNINTYKGD